MSWNRVGTTTGAAITGFTSPTYTAVADSLPDPSGKQVAVTALGGTQSGVIPHSIAAPFTANFVKPKVYRTLAAVNPVTGQLTRVARNVTTVIFRKGVLVLAGQPYQTALIRVQHDIPAGTDLADPANLKALISFAYGALWAESAGVADTLVTGIV